MAAMTFAQAANLAQDELVRGLIDSIVYVNPWYDLFPFDGIDGNGRTYNRILAYGDVQAAGVGDTITAKNATTVTPVTSALTTIVGDSEVPGLIQATQSAQNDQTGLQISVKAQVAGRTYQNWLINGTGANDQFLGLIGLCAATQKATTGGTGMNLSLEVIDEMCDMVVSKNGVVDYILMPARTRRAFKILLRALGGATITETIELPGGRKVMAYNGETPVFRNDYIPVNQTKGGTVNCTTIFAGVFDDGSNKVGLQGLTATNQFGLNVKDVGESETKDEHIWRVLWYCGLALYSELGLACADGIRN